MKIAVILPIYNEEKQIARVLDTLLQIKLPVFLINDGSTDKTLPLIKKKIRNKQNIALFSHRINLGKGSALKTGCEAAFRRNIDAVVFMDSDGQHNTSEIQKFINKLETGKYDIVLGSRNLHHGVPLIRFLGNKFASVLISVLFGCYVSDMLCGFRAITKKGYKKLDFESAGYGIETEMVVKSCKYKLKVSEIPIETIYYDKHKGVTILDAFGILFDVIRWKIIL